MSARKTKASRKPEPAYDPANDRRIVEALNRLDGALYLLLSEQVGSQPTLTARSNLAIGARAAVDLRSILLGGGRP